MYYFIINPKSRYGFGEKIWRKLECRLQNSGIKYEVRMTEQEGDARKLAEEWTKGVEEPRTLVVVGGNGTVNEVLNGVSLDSQVTLGYIPTGSGNDLARSLKLPKNPLRCLEKVLNSKSYRLVDYGILSYDNGAPVHRRFIVSSGIGLDAIVNHNLIELTDRKVRLFRRLGKLGYILVGLKKLMEAEPVKGCLVLDGVKKVEFNHIYFVSSHIHPSEGGFKFAPKASCDDGNLEVCVVHNSSKWKLFFVMLDGLVGCMGYHRGVRFYCCQELKVHVNCPLAVHADGESCFSQTDIHMRCIKKKLRIIV